MSSMEDLRGFGLFVAGFVTGFATCALLMRVIRSYAYKHKLFGIDQTERIKDAIVIFIVIIWGTTTMVSTFNGNPIDPAIHLIAGGIFGAYFGVSQLVKK